MMREIWKQLSMGVYVCIMKWTDNVYSVQVLRNDVASSSPSFTKSAFATVDGGYGPLSNLGEVYKVIKDEVKPKYENEKMILQRTWKRLSPYVYVSIVKMPMPWTEYEVGVFFRSSTSESFELDHKYQSPFSDPFRVSSLGEVHKVIEHEIKPRYREWIPNVVNLL